ncbi:MAG: hypothetical protein CMI53_01540 [Parcubacteria group bacterium]|nr:hypothetical protein [Parcubacteria group bacterium]|tara:strand:- start:10250 stop:10951 length:702 start_codon:yes stop_codon:yes gene_type:complete
MARNRFQDNLSSKAIGTGKFFTAGSFSSRAKKGLAGVLRRAKGAGKYTYAKNLSKKDMETFQKIIGKEMSQLSTHSKGLGRKARSRIMGQAENLRKEGKISAADKADLRQIVKSLGSAGNQGSKSTSTTAKGPTKRATKFVTDKSPSSRSSAKSVMTAQTKANISLDNMREMTQDAVANGAVKGVKRNLSTKDKRKKSLGGKKVKLSKLKDVTAKRGNLDQNSDNKIVELDIG